ncbi:MAG TPA: hypothetical protein PKG74_03405, partial [Candidatus Colwellbacteria bacterium]|nr:hypothetical protein [Candidatus Colwellbacteria bacterium]
MGKKEETVWDLTPDQFRILTNASRLNPIVYISKDFGGLITADQMDLALDTFYMNKKFDYKLEQSFVIH